ncbi:putative organic solute transporter subunit alpha/Transmembrane protein [Helianthus annuus]|nr:putative organic solute transporter subunit alpha/Transmembrane protein [Helianthus annuus]KAJ0696854.1 putative organic solute transporter subunit alpha/Transmembrane protein [Helianthus annuus]
MDAVRKSKDFAANKLDDIQLTTLSSSSSSSGDITPENNNNNNKKNNTRVKEVETMDTSLLADVSDSLPFDLTLVDIDMSTYSDEVPAVKESETR